LKPELSSWVDDAETRSAGSPATPSAHPTGWRGEKKRLALILLLAVLARGYALDRPWAPGDHEGYGGAFYSIVARNHVRYGYAETRLAPVLTTGEAPRHRWVYYLNHPPFIGFLVSLSFRLFGEYEWSARMVPLVFSLGSVALVYLVGTRLWSARVGWLAALFAAVVPIGVVYGTHVEDLGPALVFFALVLFEAYRRGHRWLPGVALAFGGGFDWPVHCMAAVLTVHALWTGQFSRNSVRVLPLISLAWLSGFLLYAETIAPQPEQNYVGVKLLDGFLFWSGHDVDPQHFPGYPLRKPTTTEWLSRTATYHGELFTLPLLALASIGLGVCLARRQAGPLVILLSWGLLYIAVFPMGAFVHDYFWTLITPGIVLAAAVGAVTLLEWSSSHDPSRGALRWTAALAVLGLSGYCLFVGTSRIERTRRHQASFGKMLRGITRPDEGLLSLHPMDMRDKYYADRWVRQGVNRLSLFEEAMADPDFRYRYFIVPRSLIWERPAKPLFQRLEGHYRRTQFEGFYLYDIGTPALGQEDLR
jgi:4-amino-4-deoxy-L-arabinose transferase-like glycosyltransferase